MAVGRDGRLSGPALSQALMAGLVDVGIEVIDVGMCTTPMLYFAAATLCKSGIMVTGSHNPKDYNGFKMVLAGRAIYGPEIQALRQTMEAESWQLQAGGSIRQADVLADYTARIVGDVKLSRPVKIVVDCGNGVAGATAPGIFRALGCECWSCSLRWMAISTTIQTPASQRTCAMWSRPCRKLMRNWDWHLTVTATAWAL